jgi:UDP-glucose 4-epimerase
MPILLTGGAGYIGSITNRYLQTHGLETVIFDNLSTGHRENVADQTFFQGDLRSKEDLARVFAEHFIEGVIHFGALALAGESMQKPREYYETNVMGTVNLLETMKNVGCKTIVFSSSCSIFGTPAQLPVTEDDPFHPESVYAETKMLGEVVLDRYEQLADIKNIKLRYFNASGAMPDGSLGEHHDPETHIVPNLIEAAMTQAPFTLFGDDYPTPDGTCIRDYIHVLDLAQAHYLALAYLQKNQQSNYFNLGSENGVSNTELVQAVEKVTGKKLNIQISPRRFGDPAAIYANASKAKEILGWKPEYSDIETIIQTVWDRQNRD